MTRKDAFYTLLFIYQSFFFIPKQEGRVLRSISFIIKSIMPMNVIPNRIAIYAKDIQNITGRSERTARKMLATIRKKLNKQKREFITIEEFCRYAGFKAEQIINFLK